MKKRNLLFILFLSGIGIGLSGCNFTNKGNSQTFYNTLAVVDSDPDGRTIVCTSYGYLAAPSLTDVSPGNCIFIRQFTLDYDNQPTSGYYTISDIVKETVNQSSPAVDNPTELGNYTLPFSSIDNVYTDEFYKGRIFIVATCKDKNPALRLVYNPSEEETDGIKNFYLQAAPSSSTPNASDVQTLYAFNLYDMIRVANQDTLRTFKDYTDQYDFWYIKAKLNYVSDTTNNEPVYGTISGNPLELYIFKNQ
ncbi:MAG: hypothetical protein FWF53_08875 [Candidatus Azobacteroides sp.]|nr:hypothetical protein [Candidatus Azobacteroides sp.]